MPTWLPLTYHWYEGEGPPNVEVTVKVTGVSAQIGFPDATIVTIGANDEPIIMLIPLEYAGLPLTQSSPEVILQAITSPSAGAYSKTGRFGPVFAPFSSHW